MDILIIGMAAGYGLLTYSIARFALKAYRRYKANRRSAFIRKRTDDILKQTAMMEAEMKLINALAELRAKKKVEKLIGKGVIKNVMVEEIDAVMN